MSTNWLKVINVDVPVAEKVKSTYLKSPRSSIDILLLDICEPSADVPILKVKSPPEGYVTPKDALYCLFFTVVNSW